VGTLANGDPADVHHHRKSFGDSRKSTNVPVFGCLTNSLFQEEVLDSDRDYVPYYDASGHHLPKTSLMSHINGSFSGNG